MDKYERQLKKGILDILVLKLLSEEKMYGYQMIQELSKRSHQMFVLKEGTLYPILYRLENDGYVESIWSQPIDKEVARKYYMITSKGNLLLKQLLQLWSLYSHEVDQILEVEKYD